MSWDEHDLADEILRDITDPSRGLLAVSRATLVGLNPRPCRNHFWANSAFTQYAIHLPFLLKLIHSIQRDITRRVSPRPFPMTRDRGLSSSYTRR
jgi:hypothetical protein